ncbi:hypothetical protein Tco_0717750 [Tanacetum coccineum]
MNTCSTLVEVPACRQDSNFGLTPLKGSDISWVQLVRRILNRTTLFQGRSFCVYWIISGCQSVSSINLAPPTQYVSKSLTSLSLCPSVSDEYWVLIISTVPKLSGNDFQKFDGKLPIIDHRCLKWVFRALAIYPVQDGASIDTMLPRAWVAAPGIKSIWNSTGRVGGRPGKSLGNTSGEVSDDWYTLKLLSFRLVLLFLGGYLTSVVAGKVPYLVTFVALLSTRAIVMEMALGELGQRSTIGAEFLIHKVVGQLNSLIQRLGSGRLDTSINVIRESTELSLEASCDLEHPSIWAGCLALRRCSRSD